MCARFLGDQNSVSFITESGQYANTSGMRNWAGMVQNSTINEDIHNIEVRYLGTGDRNVDAQLNGVLDYGLNFTYYPQDWRMLTYTLGSTVDAGSPSPYTHVISTINSASGNAYTSGTKNPFMSFTWEENQKGSATGQNFQRVLIGCVVNSLKISAAQGNPVSVTVDAIGQSGTFLSGAQTLATTNGSRPFMWEDCLVHIPSGTVYNSVKSADLSIDNHMTRTHYLNGSRVGDVPVPLNLDLGFNMTLDATSENTKTLYESYFISGQTFNMMFEVTDKSAGAGSRDAYFIMSGCKIKDMSAPSQHEGINEQKVTIVPGNVIVNIDDLQFQYNPW